MAYGNEESGEDDGSDPDFDLMLKDIQERIIVTGFLSQESGMKLRKSKSQVEPLSIPSWLKLVDVDGEDFWENADDTIVFIIPENLNRTQFLELLEFVGTSNNSEYDTQIIEGKTVCRMYAKWWREYE
jgi:hypothetical protein